MSFFSDENLRQHKIIIAVVVIAVGTVLIQFGFDHMIVMLVGAASGFLSRELFGALPIGPEDIEEQSPQEEIPNDRARERIAKG
jgi:hypothetical protein